MDNTQQTGQPDAAEAQQIQDIAWNHFVREEGSADKAQEMMNKLGTVVSEPGTKLVHIGNILFLIQVRAKGIVEIHIIGHESSPSQLASDIKQLAAYLRNIEVKMAYGYTEEKRLEAVIQMTGLPIKVFPAMISGKEYTTYAMEF